MNLKINRVYFYLFIILLFNAFHIMGEIHNENLEEGISETFVILPVCFIFALIIYWSRVYLKEKLAPKIINTESKLQYLSFWTTVIILKTTILTFVLKAVFDYNDDDVNEYFFDLGFWAILLVFFVIIIFFYLVELFIESQQEKQDIKIKLAQYQNEKSVAQYLALKKQLNPHFLFNSFNSLSGLISTDAKKAEYFLQELSNIYRYNLTQSDEVVVPLKKELELINSYISLQKIRFPNNIIFKNSINESQLNLLIPPMTLELLFENAIKHNIIENSKPLKISIVSEGNNINVINNFQPKNNDYEKSLGIGQKNLINQYKMLHPKSPSFTVINGNYIASIPLIQPEI
ncbi:sensor histidine kinase [Aquimarina sp. 2201CG5-10]|uniref:sensor histidine kinase n=1 Tax=Aquimarina callyspongiae TaxID=3098150 RepID=UPI002AB3CFBE|nr:histidine kinase [Aquimarina sp. 2201CG5-10]MDY8134007.1 histidine kinase [Aquimarina sp. 2201CG5-10]